MSSPPPSEEPRANRATRALTTPLTAISALSVLILATMVFVSVFFRYFLSSPLIAAEDVTSFSLAIIVFAAYPYVTAERRHVKVELLVGLFRPFPALNRLRLILLDLAVIGITMFIGLRLWQQAEKFASRGSSTSSMHWPLWPLTAACTALAFVAALILVLRIVGEIRAGTWGSETS